MINLAILAVLVLAAIGLLIGLIVWQMRVAAARKAALQAWCGQRGFTYTERNDALEHAFQGFAPFGSGSDRRCTDIIEGTAHGHPIRAFHYQYTVQGNKSSTTYHNQVLAIQMALDGRDLDIKKEHLGHKLFDALGGEDIDFESDAFSRAFWVKCKDRRLAYDLLHPQMQEWLLANGRRHWQWRGTTLLLYDGGRLEPARVDATLALAFGFIGLLPRHRRPAEASV